jgi:hypothetical protein
VPGDADKLWEPGGYERVLDAVGPLGLSGVRLSLEWSRLEPRPDEPDGPAYARYRGAIIYARSLGLHVTGVMIDAAWPSWLGPEAWLLPWVAPRVLRHAERLVAELGDELDALVGFARPQELASGGYLYATCPPWRTRSAPDAERVGVALEDLGEQLRQSKTVGPLLVPSFREVPVLRDAPAMAALLGEVSSVTEVHLRSLVRGAGPTASAVGLLERSGDSWRVGVSDEVLASLV